MKLNKDELMEIGMPTQVEAVQEVDEPVEQITLDSQQAAIVYSSSKNIIVVAGAGSGKTRVITERVKYLLESGVAPQNIVAITFTNLAAEEMKQRLKNVEGIGDTFIGTIHSFANKIMQNSGEEYQLYNDDLDNRFYQHLTHSYCSNLTFQKYLKYKDLKQLMEIGRISEEEVQSYLLPSEWAELSLLNRTKAEIEKEVEEDGATQYPESIETLCEKYKVISFDDLLVKAKKYFESINAQVEYLLVDEFQDVGTYEHTFIKGLNAQNNFFVGDDYQSIYGFKGGEVSFFLKLVENSNFDTFYLTNNYRNSKQVLNIADTVISQVSNKITKKITPKVDEEGSVQIMSQALLGKALRDLQIDGNYKDWFILTRTNKELFKIVNECELLGIPCVTFKREGLTLAQLNANMKQNKVKILTVHTSKGLESDNVILYGRFPIQCPSYLNNEDERKVMYVGVTRARKNLIILN